MAWAQTATVSSYYSISSSYSLNGRTFPVFFCRLLCGNVSRLDGLVSLLGAPSSVGFEECPHSPLYPVIFVLTITIFVTF